MGAKDASALINGSTASLALGVLAVNDARRLLKQADIALCLSLEAMRGELAAFDPRLHEGASASRPGTRRPQCSCSPRRRSKRCSQAARDIVFPEENRAPGKPAPPRVQDVYSLRCAPQVHGPAVEAIEYVERILGDRDQRRDRQPADLRRRRRRLRLDLGRPFPRPVHGAGDGLPRHRHGRPRRDIGAPPRAPHRPGMSYGLPRNLLAGKRGLNTGYATVQCSMSALVMENRGLATPGSVDSHTGQGQCRGPRVELDLVRAQGARHRRECRADRCRRAPDGGAGPVPGRADRRRFPGRQGHPGGARRDPRGRSRRPSKAIAGTRPRCARRSSSCARARW